MSLQNADYERGYTDYETGGGAAGPLAKEAAGEKDKEEEGESGATLLKWFADAYRGHETWRRKAIESLQFVSGEQWPKEALDALPPNMAPLVINLMLMPLLYLSGVERQTRTEAKIVATTGGSPQMAMLMNELVHWVETQSVAEEVDSRVFLDKLTTGLGWWKYTMNYDCDDLEGEPEIRRRPALAIFPDPNMFDVSWRETRYVFDTEMLTIGEASTRWPDHAEEFKTQTGEWLRTAYGDSSGSSIGIAGYAAGDSLADERLFWDAENKRVRIAECWYKVTKEREVAVSLANPDEIHMLEDEVEKVKEAMKSDPAAEQAYLIFKKPMTVVRVAHLFHDKKLDDEVTPWEENPQEFPILPSVGYYFWQHPFGLAEVMKGLQLEKNKRRSKLIELIGRMPLSGFLNKESDGADQKQLEEYGAGNGVVVNYRQTPPVPLQPPALPMAVIRLEEEAGKEIKEVVNVHDEMLGEATQKTISGDAIEARQRGGFISHESLFDSFRLEKQERVRFAIGVIQQYISPTKALRILGTLASQGNQQLDQMLGAATASPMVAQDIMKLLSDAFDAEYDVVISSKPTEPSLAMQAWETLSTLKQKGAEIPPKTLWTAAEKAGILDEAQVQEILEFIAGQQGGAPGGGGQPGMPGGAMPPAGGPPPGQGPPPPPPPQAPPPPPPPQAAPPPPPPPPPPR